jgi:hypothetical protein
MQKGWIDAILVVDVVLAFADAVIVLPTLAVVVAVDEVVTSPTWY